MVIIKLEDLKTENKINDERFWELSTGKIHHDLNEGEEQELNSILSNDKKKKQFEGIQQLNSKIRKVGLLKSVSIYRSQRKIQEQFRHKKIQMWTAVAKYAAIVLLAFTVGNIFNLTDIFNTTEEKFAEVIAPMGQMSRVQLPDGSQVWLNSGTKLSYNNNFGTNSRNLRLQGEAFFKVEKSKIPFKVKLKSMEIEVLGTSFNVVSYKKEDYSQVTLVEGEVKLKKFSGKEILVLKPSEQYTVSDNCKNKKLKVVDTNFYINWINGKVVFDEERLEDVATKLRRWYNVRIDFSHPELKNIKFSGTIQKNKSVNHFTDAIEELLHLKVEYTSYSSKKDFILISKK